MRGNGYPAFHPHDGRIDVTYSALRIRYEEICSPLLGHNPSPNGALNRGVLERAILGHSIHLSALKRLKRIGAYYGFTPNKGPFGPLMRSLLPQYHPHAVAAAGDVDVRVSLCPGCLVNARFARCAEERDAGYLS
jgi:hypothetical protein